MRRTLALFCFLMGVDAVGAPGPYEGEIASFRETLSAMVRADTTNPPGNESRIVDLVAKRLTAEGIGFETVEFAPGRGCIVARLKGTGPEKPLLLLAHLDVVGAENQAWSSDPHTVMEKDGYLVGRGVADDLGMAAMELELFVHLHRSRTALRRDVILALTGDEEVGGAGIEYLLRNRPELVNAGIALNEGGGPVLGDDGKVKFIGLQTAEKTYQDFAITAAGTTGHSSVPVGNNAIYRLSRALDRLGKFRFPPKLLPMTRRYFERRAALEPPPMAAAMRRLARSRGNPPRRALEVVESNPEQSANLRTTCVATMIQGGTKENALPAEARANVNCRILPGESVASVRAQLVAAIADPRTEVKTLGEFPGGPAAVVDGEVPTAVEKVAARLWAGAPVIPTLSVGASDSRSLLLAGIQSYGIHPIAMTEEDGWRMHGVDERIPLASLRPAFQFLQGLVLELAMAQGGAE